MNHENPASASFPRLIWLILRLHHHRTEVRGMHGCHSWSRYSSLAQGQALKLPELVLSNLSLSLLEDRALGLELCGKRKASTKASKQNNKLSNQAKLQHLAPLALLGNDAIQKETSWLLCYVSYFSITKLSPTALSVEMSPQFWNILSTT